ncbi:cytochrome cL apoprotein [Arboricoccus pini]|uniref:Cytochrome c-L n=1 Tax=Arboricoccus pini TaxID=1963835 RepID=A0A212R0P3_9PROT|nr:cytochrome c(L), periplasmic [Arboricoccus pini]SNB65529.1 cytochrome cL apoprotein [Arboricoccus pini]
MDLRAHNIFLAIALSAGTILPAVAQESSAPFGSTLPFQNAVTGEPLDWSMANEEGRDTPAVKEFFKTGHNPYTTIPKNCLTNFENVFLTSCSGCHGHLGEGKIGPGLNDNYWTYPAGKTDVGLFSIIYGGAQAQMGPHSDLELDQILQVMAWVRHLYKDGVADATWLTDDQKKSFKPYDEAADTEVKKTEDPAKCEARPFE